MNGQFVHHSTGRFQTGEVASRHSGPGQTSWSACSDEDLLVRYARQGTREAFEELVHRYERELSSYLRRYLHSTHLAEDALQAVFLQVHLKCRVFDPQRPFRPWLYRIATNRAIDLLRKNQRWGAIRLGLGCGARTSSTEDRAVEEVADAHNAGPRQQLEAGEDLERLRVLAESLPARLRDVVVLIMLRGLPYQEAADMLRIPLGTVKSRLHSALLHLRRTVVVAA